MLMKPVIITAHSLPAIVIFEFGFRQRRPNGMRHLLRVSIGRQSCTDTLHEGIHIQRFRLTSLALVDSLLRLVDETPQFFFGIIETRARSVQA